MMGTTLHRGEIKLAGAVTVKAFANDSLSVPVVTVTVLAPVAAAGSMLICAVRVVELETVTPTTVMPAPRLTWVVP